VTKPLNRIAFVSSGSPKALGALKELAKRYGNAPIDACDVIVALGGDGFVLHCFHEYLDTGTPIYGMNRGTVGFLMNEYEDNDLPQMINAAKPEILTPLTMSATRTTGEVEYALAFNEVSVLRSSRQSANLKISINSQTEIEKLICDGALVATPAGSTAYNLSVHGPVVPIGSGVIALTPVSAFRPRRWRGALLPDDAIVTFQNLDCDKRPINASADHTEVTNVESVTITKAKDKYVVALFNDGHSLNERILREQFAV